MLIIIIFLFIDFIDDDYLDVVQDLFLSQFVDKPMRDCRGKEEKRWCAVLDIILSNDLNMVEEVEGGEHLGQVTTT